MKFLFPIPANSIITQTFAEHVHRAQVNHWQYYYGGIDWGIPTGTPVKAAQDGQVLELRRDATGYGTHVRLQHADGYLTIYGHMMDFAVVAGQTVKAGDVLGRSDNTGNSTGPHLHFELRLNNVPIDPAPLLVALLAGGPTEGGGEPGGAVEEGELTPGKEPKKWPKLPKVRVTSNIGLNVRQGPGLVNSPVGYLPGGAEVEVLRKVEQGPDVWLQIGYNQYIALVVAGQTLAQWV